MSIIKRSSYTITIFIFLIFLFSCKNSSAFKFFTIFYLDKNGIFIPLSYKSSDIYNDSQKIIYSITGINVKKIVYSNQKLLIDLEDIPKVKYEFDTFLLYESLFLSFFNSFYIDDVNLIYDQKDLVLNGIEFSMNYKDYYKYPINDFFKISDSRKGKYYLYSYVGSDNNEYLVPFLLPRSYNLNDYFQRSTQELYSISNVKVDTFDKALKKRLNITLIGWESTTITFKTYSLINFLHLLLNKQKLYVVFYNFDIQEVVIKYDFLWWTWQIREKRKKLLSLDSYPLNVIR